MNWWKNWRKKGAFNFFLTLEEKGEDVKKSGERVKNAMVIFFPDGKEREKKKRTGKVLPEGNE